MYNFFVTIKNCLYHLPENFEICRAPSIADGWKFWFQIIVSVFFPCSLVSRKRNQYEYLPSDVTVWTKFFFLHLIKNLVAFMDCLGSDSRKGIETFIQICSFQNIRRNLCQIILPLNSVKLGIYIYMEKIRMEDIHFYKWKAFDLHIQTISHSCQDWEWSFLNFSGEIFPKVCKTGLK